MVLVNLWNKRYRLLTVFRRCGYLSIVDVRWFRGWSLCSFHLIRKSSYSMALDQNEFVMPVIPVINLCWAGPRPFSNFMHECILFSSAIRMYGRKQHQRGLIVPLRFYVFRPVALMHTGSWTGSGFACLFPCRAAQVSSRPKTLHSQFERQNFFFSRLFLCTSWFSTSLLIPLVCYLIKLICNHSWILQLLFTSSIDMPPPEATI